MQTISVLKINNCNLIITVIIVNGERAAAPPLKLMEINAIIRYFNVINHLGRDAVDVCELISCKCVNECECNERPAPVRRTDGGSVSVTLLLRKGSGAAHDHTPADAEPLDTMRLSSEMGDVKKAELWRDRRRTASR